MAAVLVLVVKVFFGPLFLAVTCSADSRPALLFSENSAMLGPQWFMFASFYVLVDFLVSPREKVDSDPEVASLWAQIALSLSVAGTFVFIAVCDPPLVSDSHLLGVSPEDYKIWIFWEILPELFLYSALSGSTADTCGASVYGVFHILRELVDYGSSGRFSTCSFSAFAWFHSEYKFTWLVFLVTMHLALYSFVVLSGWFRSWTQCSFSGS